MVYGVVACAASRVFLNQNFELLRRRGGLLRCSSQAQKTWIECGYVLLENLARIAFRVSSDEQEPHPIRIGPKLLHRRGELGHCGGTDIGAMRIAEEQRHHFAVEVR